MIETMRLEELKEALEKATKLEFEIKDKFGKPKVFLKGLRKNEEISLGFGRYRTGNQRFISVCWMLPDQGAGAPCDSIESAIDWIVRYYVKMGYSMPKERITQLSLFD